MLKLFLQHSCILVVVSPNHQTYQLCALVSAGFHQLSGVVSGVSPNHQAHQLSTVQYLVENQLSC